MPFDPDPDPEMIEADPGGCLVERRSESILYGADLRGIPHLRSDLRGILRLATFARNDIHWRPPISHGRSLTLARSIHEVSSRGQRGADAAEECPWCYGAARPSAVSPRLIFGFGGLR